MDVPSPPKPVATVSSSYRGFYATAAAVLCIGFYYVRRYCRGAVCQIATRLDGKTVLITGANSGIGAATAEILAKRGARVIMACRDMLKAERVAFDIVERTGSKQIVIQHLDLSSFDSIQKFVDRIKYEEQRLDILINNAGVSMIPEMRTREGLEFEFGVNHMGHFLLTMMLMDLLKKSSPSRIINVSSSAHKHGGEFDFDNLSRQKSPSSKIAYMQSKLANLLFSKELARRLAGTGIVVMSLHPGVVMTSIFRDAPIWFKSAFLFLTPILKTSTDGAQTSVHCALLDPTPDMIAGKASYYSECARSEPADYADRDADARRLWDWSVNFVRDKGFSIEDI